MQNVGIFKSSVTSRTIGQNLACFVNLILQTQHCLYIQGYGDMTMNAKIILPLIKTKN